MLSYDDRRAIEGLFDRLAQVERQNSHRDPEAEQMIDESIRRQPNAPYYLAQTVVVQQAALEEADRRIQDLEAKLRTQLTDGRRDGPRGPWDRVRDTREDRYERRGTFGGGGFLAGAAQTAMGVAGGMLLGNMMGSLFGAGAAHASESPADNQHGGSSDAAQDQEVDAGNEHDLADGGDFGGDGFEMGGDF